MESQLRSAVHPFAGFYDCSYATVAEWHVRLAMAAGIDAFLVDWRGEQRGLDNIVPMIGQQEGVKFQWLELLRKVRTRR